MGQDANTVDLLLKQGIITQETLQKANEESKRTGLGIEKSLEKLGIISEEEITRVKADALGLNYMNLADYLIDSDLLALVPQNIVNRYKIVPLFKIGNSITVGMSDPQDVIAQDQIRNLTKTDTVYPVLVSPKSIQKILDSYYGVAGSLDEIIVSFETKPSAAARPAGAMEFAEEPPVIKLVNLMIIEALKQRASDIHIEPEEELVRVRYRIDGILHEAHKLPKKLQNAVISRIKIISALDIAETRKPQDGSVRLKCENKEIDIRVSSFPTLHGENVVLRLLDRVSVVMGLKELGFLDEDLKEFTHLIQRPNGIILITGPTGSGKTTTLYAALSTISSMEKNIITIEDPIEYELPLIRQTQVNVKAGITFANGLRSILRQDPDIIMVGEIRDKEAADIAIQAALTGHLVFSTLHTNDAASSLTRLIDMGVEQFLVSSSVAGILAVRLVRKVCSDCQEKYLPPPDIIKQMKPGHAEFMRGKGCPACKGTGYRGRIGIFELLVLSDEIRKMVDAKSSADEIKHVARSAGMRTLRDDGFLKASRGLTTPEEVIRVTEI